MAIFVAKNIYECFIELKNIVLVNGLLNKSYKFQQNF